MKKNILDEIQSVLRRLSGVEHQLFEIRDDLTSLLLDSCTVGQQGGVLQAPVQNSEGAETKPTEETPELGVSSQVTEPESEIIDLEQWLNDRGITIKQRRPENPFDPSFDRLAKFLGERFDNLRSFYAAVKQRISGSSYPQTVSLKNLAPQQISDVVQFGTDLHRNSFLRDFKYIRRDRFVSFNPQDEGYVTNFFTGGWLERYVFLKTKEYLLSKGNTPELNVLINPQIVLPNGQDFELDILIATPSLVLWLECKTGSDYPMYVSRYGEIAKRYMRIPPAHSALILLESLTNEEKQNNSHLAGMSVINLSDLDIFLEEAIMGIEDDRHTPKTPPIAQTPVAPGIAEYTATLKRIRLRPLNPTVRHRIIEDLREQALTFDNPIPLPELIQALKEKYDADGIAISKSQINDVSNALRRSGVCLRGSHPDYEHDVWFLQTELSSEEMFDACARLYLWSLLKEPTLQAAHPSNMHAVATILWGDEIGSADAEQRFTSLVQQLIEAGKCVREEISGIPTVRGVGEDFLNA